MEEKIMLAHGGGGRKTAELIREVFAKRFRNLYLTEDDAAILPPPASNLAFTTDGFIVSPWKFSGGDIGKLSVCGTVNDIVCMGARPKYLSCAFVIEEGFPIKDLEEIAGSMAETAREAGIQIVTGDTKVAGRGQVDGIFITTTGIGERLPGAHPSGRSARTGDAVIVSGDVGRHGCTVLLARGSYGIDADVDSDCAPLWQMASGLFDVCRDVHVVRDATRGGVGTVLHEIAAQSGVGIHLDGKAVPVDPAVAGVCGMLGLDPLYLACEGRFVIIVPQADAEAVVSELRKNPCGENAAVIGEVTADAPGCVVRTTELGTQTILPPPTGELLPRIC